MNDELATVTEFSLITPEQAEMIREIHLKVSKIKTPKRYVKKKLGFSYVKREYMKMMADKAFPGWSWMIIGTQTLGDSAYIVHGRLIWHEAGIRRVGDMVAGHRIQKSRGGGYVDIGNDVKAANTDCFKKALNQHMNIADDIYDMDDKEVSTDQINRLINLAETIGDEYLKQTDRSIQKLKNLIENGDINTGNIKKAINVYQNIRIDQVAEEGIPNE
jgi:hypothetical protein